MNSSGVASARPPDATLAGRERFLAKVLQRALSDGWRSPEDFLRHFPPAELLESLGADPALRVRLLVGTTRVNQRLAARKTTESAAEDLEIALDEGLTDPQAVLTLIPELARVRYLSARKLWSFITEGEFWKPDSKDGSSRELQVARLTFIVECALSEGALRLQDIADGLGFKCIAHCLPQAELQRVVEYALSRARDGHQLTEEQLLEAVSLRSLMTHVPLEHTWQQVVVRRLAAPLSLIAESPAPVSSSIPSAPRRSAPPPMPPSQRGKPPRPVSPSRLAPLPSVDPHLLPASLLELQKGLERQAAVSQHELVPLDEDDSEATRMNVEDETRVDVDNQLQEAANRAEAVSELQRVTSSLREMDRLPPPTPQLTLSILLSIENMYMELVQTNDEADQLSCIREAFPNEGHLRIAMLALIRHLDPQQRTSDGVLLAASTDSLVSTLLFEERRRRET